MSVEPSDHTPGGYIAAMQRAVALTRELQFTSRTSFEAAPSLVTPDFSEIMLEWARLNICSRRDDHIAGMCMQITHELVQFLQGAGIDAICTLGWMSYRDHPVYRFTDADIRRWIADGFPDRRKVDAHAWATLPSGELVDPTWLSTVGIVQNKRDLIGAVIVADPLQTTSHQYHPVTVDTSILYRIGLLNSVSQLDVPHQAPLAAGVLAFAT